MTVTVWLFQQTELIIELTDNAKYIYDNGGYITVYFTLIGFILGVWR